MDKKELVEELECRRIVITNPEDFTEEELKEQLRYEICQNCVSYEDEDGCESCVKYIGDKDEV